MKKLTEKNIGPLTVMPGDALIIVYDPPVGRSQEVCRHTFKEPRAVDYAAVVELEAAELAQLGLEQGLAGMFGKKKDD